MKLVSRTIDVELTQEEIVKLGQDASETQASLYKREADFADYKKGEKRKIDDLKTSIRYLLNTIKRGVKEVTIDCEEHPDLFEKEFFYKHNGEEVDRRKMTLDEFDTLCEKICKIKVNEENFEKEYYYNDKLVISRIMTPDQMEAHKLKTSGQQTIF